MPIREQDNHLCSFDTTLLSFQEPLAQGVCEPQLSSFYFACLVLGLGVFLYFLNYIVLGCFPSLICLVNFENYTNYT